jgi:ATP-binding cassette subfamily F protein uup
MFVTHDRAFLRRLATRIWEVDRGRLFDWSCDYDTFLARKADALAAEEKQNALFDKRLAEEEVWIRQGIKARRTRNEGRVRALKALRVERSRRREQVGQAKLVIQEAARSGNLVCAVENLSFGYGGRPILANFSTEIFRGDKVGIIGPNGVGKTTLLRLLLGQLAPERGTVRLGTQLAVAYFDQLRGQLDGEKSIADNIAGGNDTVTIGGQRRHIIGYLQDFLFSPERARTEVRFLSGGERHRVLLAKLFTQPANVIVLDEPTNDLDAETLEMLEQRLVEFAGTILMVSHDREFLNNVATSVIAYESGGVREYVGGYDDWLRQRAVSEPKPPQPAAPPRRQPAPEPAAAPPKRRSYKEQRELESLPGTIEKLEAEIASLHEQVAHPAFYKQPATEIAAIQRRLKEFEAELAAAFQRWEALE